MQTTVIKPQRKWFDIDLKGLWRYRDLYYMYIRRDIVTQYKQTILGPLWYVIQPLFTTIMYMFVFGGLAGISTDGAPQPLFYMAGIVLWGYFSQCFTVSSDVFGANANVFGKVYFPRLVVPLSGVTSNLLKMLIQLGMFIIIYIYYVITLPAGTLQVNSSILLFPILIFLIAMHGMSWGLIISSMTTKYRDMKFLIQFGSTHSLLPLRNTAILSPSTPSLLSSKPSNTVVWVVVRSTGVDFFTAPSLCASPSSSPSSSFLAQKETLWILCDINSNPNPNLNFF